MTHDPMDFAAIIGRAAEASFEASRNHVRYQPLPEGFFPAASLSAWLELLEDAGIPHVPATIVARLPLKSLLDFENGQDPDVRETMDALERANAKLDENSMLRWDPCGGFGLKSSMEDGVQPQSSDLLLHPGEPRTFDILYEFPADEVAVLHRPWVTALDIDGMPLELRVFVIDGEPVAVANYYLQRDLPDTELVRRSAREALDATRKVLAVMKERGIMPAMPYGPTPTAVAASLDFLVTPQGEVLFLEAGPGHYEGAHPCAFLLPDNQGVADLDGLRLGSTLPTIPLSDLE